MIPTVMNVRSMRTYRSNFGKDANVGFSHTTGNRTSVTAPWVQPPSFPPALINCGNYKIKKTKLCLVSGLP